MAHNFDMVQFKNDLLRNQFPTRKDEDFCDVCGEFGKIVVLLRELGNIHACQECAEMIEKYGDPAPTNPAIRNAWQDEKNRREIQDMMKKAAAEEVKP